MRERMMYDICTQKSLRRWPACFLWIALSVASTSALLAQPTDRNVVSDEFPEAYYTIGNPVLSLKGGPVYTSPEGKFPSLLIGETLRETGEIPANYSETGTGYRLGIDALFPFGSRGGLLVELASQRYEVKYRGDSLLLPTQMEVQTFQLGIGAEVNLYYGKPVAPAILRAVYLSGGFDFGFGPLANRVVGSMVTDTATGERVEGVGSFTTSEPFRTSVAVKGNLGVRIGIDQHLELMVEGGYSIALNPVFSSDAVRNSDLKLSHLIVSGGLGYRF